MITVKRIFVTFARSSSLGCLARCKMVESNDSRQLRNLSRIDTSISWSNLPSSPNIDALSPFPPSHPTIAVNEAGQLSPTPVTDSTLRRQPGNKSRALNETRKLLSHVLIQLADRQKPPPIPQTIGLNHELGTAGTSSIASVLKGGVKAPKKPSQKPERHASTEAQDESDDEIDQDFTTDETFNLLTQLKDVLNLSAAQGWRLFEDEFVLVMF